MVCCIVSLFNCVVFKRQTSVLPLPLFGNNNVQKGRRKFARKFIVIKSHLQPTPYCQYNYLDLVLLVFIDVFQSMWKLFLMCSIQLA